MMECGDLMVELMQARPEQAMSTLVDWVFEIIPVTSRVTEDFREKVRVDYLHFTERAWPNG